MAYKVRLKRLENDLQGKLSNRMSKAEQQRFISEAAEAIELYLKASTKEEEAEAIEVINNIDGKLNHELPNDFFKKYSENELRKIVNATANDETRQKGEMTNDK